jgi:cysteinyl-tRNA synthetase
MSQKPELFNIILTPDIFTSIIELMIKFFNTYSGKTEDFSPLKEGEVRLYTCGPTVYDYAHIGNYRAYMFEDLLKRFLVYAGFKVTHVMNITDIDDKTIKGANERGVSLQEYTKAYIDAFFQDIDTLNIARADHYPRATEHISEMVDIIKVLLEKGYAYKKDGSVYFRIESFPEYGKLSKIDLEQLQVGKRVEHDEYSKENLVDFVLWKAKKEGEPFWETDIGPGRPGWHIECSAMSAKYLGPTFDIHTGGVDNIFPHHENEIAQSEACFGRSFVRYWLHCHHLIFEGEKMSKSKGNTYTLGDLMEKGADPLAVRFLLLSTHYRKTLNFTFKALDQAVSSIQRIKDFVYDIEHRSLSGGTNPEISSLVSNMKEKFKESLSHDLNISGSITALFEMIKKVNILLSENQVYEEDRNTLISAVHDVDRVIGVLQNEQDILSEDDRIRIEKKIAEREDARKNRNYALADRIREELLAEGIILEDTKDGVRWKRK